MARGLKAGVGLVVLVAASGCSVMMAEHGRPPSTDLSGLREGLTRVEAELFVGSPISSISPPDGRRIEIYEVDAGTPPDKSRALVHVLLDISTLLAWEVIGTPMEAIIRSSGSTEQVAIVYGFDDRVLAVHRLGRPAPRPAGRAASAPSLAPDRSGRPSGTAEGGLP